MPKMRSARVTQPNGPFEIVECEIPEPGAGQVRVKVEACGVCHSDSLAEEGTFPGLQCPRAPGHEVAGIIDAVGEGVTGRAAEQRVEADDKRRGAVSRRAHNGEQSAPGSS